MRERQRSIEAQDFANERGIDEESAAERLEWQREAPQLAKEARAELGGVYGGVWVDPSRGDRLVLGVTERTEASNTKADRAIRTSGLEGAADIIDVRHGEHELYEVYEWLTDRLQDANRQAPLPVVFGIEPDHNHVVASVSKSTEPTPEQREALNTAAEKFGERLEVRTYDAPPTELACAGRGCSPPIRGGVFLGHPTRSYRCTSGFTARGQGPNNYLFQLTAGHCAPPPGAAVHALMDTQVLSYVGPGHNFSDGIYGDFGIYRVLDNTFWNARSWVYVTESSQTTRNEEYRIYSEGEPVQGARVCTTGSASPRSTCGLIRQPVFNDGVNGGMVLADFCTMTGDSGGPVYANGQAHGLVSRGFLASGGCTTTYTKATVAEFFLNVDITHATP